MKNIKGPAFSFFYLSFSSQPQPSTGEARLALWFPTEIHFARLVNALIWPHLPKNYFVFSKPYQKYSASTSKVPSLCKWTHPIIYYHWWRIWASKVQQAACWSTPSCALNSPAGPKLPLHFEGNHLSLSFKEWWSSAKNMTLLKTEVINMEGKSVLL